MSKNKLEGSVEGRRALTMELELYRKNRPAPGRSRAAKAVKVELLT